MKDDAKREVQLYQYFSECLKLFMKKMILVTKIFHSDSQQLTKKLSSNMEDIFVQGSKLLDRFDELSDDLSKIQPIFSRFMLRVRQSVHNFYLKTSVDEVISFLKYLQNIIKQFSLSSNMKIILKIILIKTPRKLINSVEIAQKEESQSLKSPLKILQAANLKPKQNSHFDCYEKYLQALSRQYRLFDCLNIEQTFYRRTFFLALEDNNKKNNNLFEQMLFRNRYTKQSLQGYEKDFENNKKRQLQKKSRLLKTQIDISISEMKDKKVNYNILSVYKDNSAPKQQIDQIINRRLKTDYNSKASQRQTSIIFESLHNFKNKKLRQSSKQSIMTPNRMKLLSSSYNRQQFFSATKIQESKTATRNNNFIQLKKVHFKGLRIELVPEQVDKQSQKLKQEQKRKKLNSRTNEQFRKKISFINQPRIQRPIQQRQLSQQKDSRISSIRIDNFKIQR